MELEEPTQPFSPVKDSRRHIPERPVVRVVAIEDVHLPCVAGTEVAMNRFYVDLLKFERVIEQACPGILYRGENRLLRFDIHQVAPGRDDLRPLMVEIPHFADFVRMLDEQEIEYEWQKGLAAGMDVVLLRDPSGNWIGVTLRAMVR